MAESRNDVFAVGRSCQIEYKANRNPPETKLEVDFLHCLEIKTPQDESLPDLFAVSILLFPSLSSTNHHSSCQALFHRLQ